MNLLFGPTPVIIVTVTSGHSWLSYDKLPDVAAHFHIQENIIGPATACGAAVAAPRASRAGLPLRDSGPDNVWQSTRARARAWQQRSNSARSVRKHLYVNYRPFVWGPQALLLKQQRET